jgi:nucleoside triphosphate pyrophosphatase
LGVRLVLASTSPRRADLLRAAGFEFDVIIPNVDESIRPGETPEQHVSRLAEQKALRVLPEAGSAPTLGADTVVVVDDTILGKPADERDAARMLRMLSGRRHQVMTGVALVPDPAKVGPQGSISLSTGVAVTTVEFAALNEAEIAAYIASGEPMDKAGAYGIQGFASRFVTGIEGSCSNVIGLPVALVYDLCKRAGLLVS